MWFCSDSRPKYKFFLTNCYLVIPKFKSEATYFFHITYSKQKLIARRGPDAGEDVLRSALYTSAAFRRPVCPVRPVPEGS